MLERHRRARQILCVDPATLSQMVTVSSMLPIGFSSTRRRAPTPLVWSPMALVARRPLPMASEIRKVGEQCPYRVGGRRHATLHPDVTFRHVDHSGVWLTLGQVPVHIIAPADPAQQSTDPTRGVSGRFPPGLCGPSLRNVRVASVRRPSPRRSAAEPLPAGRTPLPESSQPSLAGRHRGSRALSR